MDEVRDTRSLGHIVGDIARDAQNLVRGELALARAELDQKFDQALMGLVRVFGGMFVAFAGLVVLLLAAAAALTRVIPVWAALLVVGLIVAIIGAIFTRSGIASLSVGTLAPRRTARNVQADAEVLKGTADVRPHL
jgi:hypothetical protein